MSIDKNDTGVILSILESFEKQRLPRIIEIQEQLNKGYPLNEFDIEFLSEALHDSECMIPYLERNQEYKAVFTQFVSLYKSVTDEATRLVNA